MTEALLTVCLLLPTGSWAPDSAWSWWSGPIGVEYESDLVVGGISSNGDIQVTVDGVTTVIARIEADDHNAPAFAVKDGKPLHVFYTEHRNTPFLYWQTRAETWTANEPLVFEEEITYVQVLSYEDTIVLVTRVGVNRWDYVVSSDWGTTWSSPRTLIDAADEGLVYVTFSQHSDDPASWRMAAYGHPDNSEWRTIEYALIRLSDGDVVLPHQELIGNIYAPAGPAFSPGDLATAYAPEESHRVRLLDLGEVRGEAAVVFAEWDLATHEADYWTATYTPSGWEKDFVRPAGAVFGHRETAHYHGGAAFSIDGLVTSAESDGLWVVQDWSFSGNWDAELLVAHTAPLVRPLVIGDRLLFQRVLDYDGYQDFSIDSFVVSRP